MIKILSRHLGRGTNEKSLKTAVSIGDLNPGPPENEAGVITFQASILFQYFLI
jgi:hypothetical protein